MEPITRKEMFLAGAAGQDVPQLTPVTREEYFISQISAGGGGGGGGGNVLTLYGRMEEGDLVVYIDPEYTKERFDTYQEAADAVMGADSIKLVFDVVEKGATIHNCQFAQNIVCNENLDVVVTFFKVDCTLWQEEETSDPGGGNMA